MCATSFVCVVLLFWACQLVFDIFIEPSVREAISQVCRCGLGPNSGALILSAVGCYHASAAAAATSSSVVCACAVCSSASTPRSSIDQREYEHGAVTSQQSMSASIRLTFVRFIQQRRSVNQNMLTRLALSRKGILDRLNRFGNKNI